MPRKKQPVAVSAEQIEQQIFIIRGQRVMLDSDLARLYGVPTKVLNQAVRQNPERFLLGFAFQLTLQAFSNLLAQIVLASAVHEGRIGSQAPEPSSQLQPDKPTASEEFFS